MIPSPLPERPTFTAIALVLAFSMIRAVALGQTVVVVRGTVPDTCLPAIAMGELVQLGRQWVDVPRSLFVSFTVRDQDTSWVMIPGETKRRKFKMETQEYRSPNCPELLYWQTYKIAKP